VAYTRKQQEFSRLIAFTAEPAHSRHLLGGYPLKTMDKLTKKFKIALTK